MTSDIYCYVCIDVSSFQCDYIYRGVYEKDQLKLIVTEVGRWL